MLRFTFCLAVGHVMSIDSLIMKFGVRKYWSFNKSSQPLPIAHDWSFSFVESRLSLCKRFSIHNHKYQGFVWKSFSNSKAYLTNFGLKMAFWEFVLKMRRFFRPIFRCFRNVENWSGTFGWYLWKRWENCFSCMNSWIQVCSLRKSKKYF